MPQARNAAKYKIPAFAARAGLEVTGQNGDDWKPLFRGWTNSARLLLLDVRFAIDGHQ
jgi:hypothetical protein